MTQNLFFNSLRKGVKQLWSDEKTTGLKTMVVMLLMLIGNIGFANAYTGNHSVSSSVAVDEVIKITGRIRDVNNDPMVGVSVVLKGTNVGTVTDLNGNFSLNVKSSGDVIRVSYLGYKTKEFGIGGIRNFNITMEEDEKVLD